MLVASGCRSNENRPVLYLLDARGSIACNTVFDRVCGKNNRGMRHVRHKSP